MSIMSYNYLVEYLLRNESEEVKAETKKQIKEVLEIIGTETLGLESTAIIIHKVKTEKGNK